MAINLKFDLMGNPEPPSIVLATRSGNKLGQLNVKTDSIDVIDKFNDASEFSFTLNKYVDGELTPLWDKVVDFKLVYCPQWDLWFEIRVELDEATETVKTVFCTQLGQAELSQIKLYDVHINEEGDPNWDVNSQSYKSTILYDENDASISLLNRLLKDKAPHYSIRYVSPTIARIQRTFSFDDISICDAFQEIAEEIGCLFVYHSNSGEDGKIQRAISVYDLQQKCNACGYRGEFTDKCPECNSMNITNGYGDDTLIFVTSDELATEGIQLTTDTDSVKNCFKLKAGDDLMTATVRNCNPNGTDYIWYFSDAIKEDMSDRLVAKIESYDELYKDYYDNRISTLDATLVNKYNALVDKYKDYYNTPSTCLNCGHKGDFYDICPKCGNENILTGRNLQSISSSIKGYSSLMNIYYNVIDLGLYLKSSLMPSIEMSETTAEQQIKLLDSVSLSPVAVNVKDVNSISSATANSAVLSMAKVIIKPTYKVEIKNSDTTILITNNKGTKTWKGKFVVTNYSDENDVAESDEISVEVNNDNETFIKQKLDKALEKTNTDDYSISGLFEKDYNAFCAELKKYALNPLQSFYDACQTCLSILTEQGVGTDTNSDLYKNLYTPYSNKSDAIANEISLRQDEINTITGVYDIDGKLTTDGLQTKIEKCRNDIQDALDFESYLGKDLWLEFCLYRREDTYSNDNYISDGLNNAELFDKALEFFKVAENEIYKSAELQHSISTTLNNLLGLEKFKPLVDSFKVGNWIRVQIDDKIFKLRLLECKFGYGNVENISVEFSDVTKIKNGITDIQDVISQASSMATSYSSVKKQADQGSIAQGTIEQWITNGLDAANTQIKNNNAEEIVITSSGLLGRSYDSISGTYSDEQIKLTHNILAYTNDGWETVKQAIGKHKYTKWENNKWVENVDGYGSTSDFVTAGYITGSQVIGGEIVSYNYKPREQGTYINLVDGEFEFAGGKIAYDTNDNALTLKGVTIQWDSTNAPEITNITGLGKYLDQIKDLEDKVDGTQTSASEAYERAEQAEENAKGYADAQDKSLSNILTDAYKEYTNSQINNLDSYVAQYLGLGGNTIIGEDYVISPIIEGGYLNITNVDNNSRVIIDPNNLTGNNYIFQVHNGDKVTVGVDKDGNTEFSGKVTATSGYIGDATNGFVIKNTYITNKKTSYDDTINDGVYLGTDGIGLGKGVFYVNDSGEMTTTKGTIGGWLIEDNFIVSEDKSVGLYSHDDDGSDIVKTTDNSLIDGSYKSIRFFAGAPSKADLNDAPFRVLSDGSLYASAAKITGSSQIGGFQINENDLYYGKTTYNDTENNGVYLGVDGIGLGKGTFYVDSTGAMTATSGKIGAIKIRGTSLYIDDVNDLNKGAGIYGGELSEILYYYYGKKTLTKPLVGDWTKDYSPVRFYAGCYHEDIAQHAKFSVLEDGSLYASAAEITGTIHATEGKIGDLKIDKGIKGYTNNEETFSLTSDGLTIKHPSAKIRVGNFETFYDSDTDNTYWQTNGALYIQGMESGEPITAIELMTDKGTDSINPSIYLDVKSISYLQFSSSVEINLRTTQRLYYPIDLTIYYLSANEHSWTLEPDWNEENTQSITLRLDAGQLVGTSEILQLPSGRRKHIRFGLTFDTSTATTINIKESYESNIEHSMLLQTITQTKSKNNIKITGNLVPSQPDASGYNLGDLSYYWNTIYVRNGTVDLSDKNKKNTIHPLSSIHESIFDALNPVSYKFNINNNNRTHTGFLAQDVKQAVEAAGLTTQDFAAYCEWIDENGEVGCGLRYSELIALCVNEIQKLKKRVAELENK